MDKLANYKQIVQGIIHEHSQIAPAYGQVEMEEVADVERGHFQLMSVGWKGNERVHGCLLHVDIKNDKIWIQYDGIDGGIANELVARGIPKQDIVLAFHAKYKRPYTEFAVE